MALAPITAAWATVDTTPPGQECTTALPDGTKVDSAAGTVTIGGLTLDWDGAVVTYTVDDGFTLDLCVKSGTKSFDGAGFGVTAGLTGTGTMNTGPTEGGGPLQDISHIVYRLTAIPTPEPTPTPTPTPLVTFCVRTDDVTWAALYRLYGDRSPRYGNGVYALVDLPNDERLLDLRTDSDSVVTPDDHGNCPLPPTVPPVVPPVTVDEVPPVEQPPTEVEAVDTVVAAPEAAQDAAGAVPEAELTQLPFTGSHTPLYGALAAMLLGVGTVVLRKFGRA